MKRAGKLILFLSLFAAGALQAQFPYYKKFAISDGLISNKVYNIIEDRHGFIWICTDLGVSRYDGVEFTNFTSRDGLPENEVLNTYEDRKGRVWFNTFSSEPCYYYNGRIYNASSDSFLMRVRKHKPEGMCMAVMMPQNGGIAFVIDEGDHKLIIGKEIEDIYLKASKGHSVRGYLYQNILYHDSSGYQLLSSNELIRWKPGKEFESITVMWSSHFNYSHNPATRIDILYTYNEWPKHLMSIDLAAHQIVRRPVEAKYNKLFICGTWHILLGDSLYSIFDSTFTKVLETEKLPFAFERIYIDKHGNRWFGTFDNGVYLIRKNAPVNLRLPQDKMDGIIGIETLGDKLMIRTETHGLMSLDRQGSLKTVFYNPEAKRAMGWAVSGKYIVTAHDGGIFRFNKDFKSMKRLSVWSGKDVEQGFDGEVLIASAAHSAMYHSDWDSLRRIAKGRGTAICRIDKKTIWIGKISGIEKLETVNGQYIVSRLNLDEGIDKSRIMDIKLDKAGNVWVATSQKGLFFCPRQGSIVRFSETSGFPQRLLSDMCNQIKVAPDSSIWLATVRGISVIRYHGRGDNVAFNVRNYSIPEGMPGKAVYSIEFWNGKVVVATPFGLFSFNHFPAPLASTAETIITEIRVNAQVFNTPEIVLPYHQNNLIVSYASSFVNTGVELSFHYRVQGLSDNWIETKAMQVPLLGLEPGEYTFDIASLNSLGQPGRITTLHITILTPWFRRWWFIAIVALAALLVVLYYVKLWRDKVTLGKNLTLLRLRILRAQMNPHFVFNALGNIQRLMHVGESKNATGYLSVLASIMRKNIEYSGKEFIQLDKEIEYTRHYLEIETLRFRNKFDYSLICELDKEECEAIFVPPLLLQPLAENSIKHAFKGLPRKGLLEIRIYKPDESKLSYVIRDNGCGFDTNAFFPKDHGLGIARERVELLYKNMDTKSTFRVVSDMQGPGQGTVITIELPILKD